MLSIAKINPSQASSYYAEDNYYSKETGVQNSAWWGNLAQDFGLKGPVDPKVFDSLVNGFHPQSNLPLVDRSSMHSGKMRAGVDLTFSAPKSVSLCALKDERISEAHKRAVETSLEILQQEFCFVRRGKQRNIIKNDNLLVAKFHHDSARQVRKNVLPDPQLHTHCVVINATKTKEGKFLSVFNDSFYDHSKLIGLTYQNELAKELSKLGYEIELTTHHTIEIKGYTKEQLEIFSKRRKQILEKGALNQKEARKIVLEGRVAKTAIFGRNDLKTYWKNACEEYGIAHPVPLKEPKEIKSIESPKALDSAIKHQSEREVGFSQKSLLEFALAEHLGKVASLQELKSASKEALDLIPIAVNRYGHHGFTTSKALNIEMETIRIMEAGKSNFKAIFKESEKKKFLEKSDKTYTIGQKEALSISLLSRDQFLAWQGVAGSGKSYALQDLKNSAIEKGYSVMGLAPDAESAKVLKESALLPDAKTIASFLLETEVSAKKRLWIIDEAGKISAKDMLGLFKKAKLHSARIILIGDKKQLAAVEAGNPFKSLQNNGIQTAYLTEHRRQKDLNLKTCVELIANDRVTEGIKFLAQSVVCEPKDSNRMKIIANDYLALEPKDREQTLILCGTNDERKELTEKIRNGLKTQGLLQNVDTVTILKQKDLTTEKAKFAKYYEPGDVVYFMENKGAFRSGIPYRVQETKDPGILLRDDYGKSFKFDPCQEIKRAVYRQEEIEIAQGDKLKWTKNHGLRRNGQNMKVVNIKDGKAEIESDKGKSEWLDIGKPQFFDHAFVHTVFSSQGKTCEKVMVSVDHTFNKKTLYVALSRAKYKAKVYAKDMDQLEIIAAKGSEKQNAIELVKMNLSKEKTVRIKEDQSVKFEY